MTAPYIVFSHGKDGEPWGTKIVAMAEVARRQGLAVESVDYRGMDDPAARVQRLLDVCRKLTGKLVLVGSSLGGHVSVAAARAVPVRGLFLLAPAFYMPGYEQYTPEPPKCPIAIVHGWNDDIVPPENSIRYARQYRTTLHLIDSDHRLTANVDEVCELLERFLKRLPAA
ncbi:MAG TPA: alpha/beta fold hydrolase [Steroidobacteraceae bacterium]